MQKFTFINPEKTLIKHNIDPKFEIEVIVNDSNDYSKFNDCYEQFEFMGNDFVFKHNGTEDEIEIIEDFRLIRSILRRAWKFYRSNVEVIPKVFVPGKAETEQYKLDKSKDGNGWVVADKINLIVVQWQDMQFNETQKLTLLEDFDTNNVSQLAKMLSQIGHWLAINHKDKI